jgi:hypothetical protein
MVEDNLFDFADDLEEDDGSEDLPNLSEMTTEEESSEEEEEQKKPWERSREQIAVEVFRKSQSANGVDMDYIARHYRLPVVDVESLISRGKKVVEQRELEAAKKEK